MPKDIMTTLASLPPEIFLHVVSALPTTDRCCLACTSKHMHGLVNPLIWANIEFHHEGYHESEQELEVPAPYIAPLQHDLHTGAKGWKVLYVLRRGAKADGARQRELMALIKTLCGVVAAEHSIRFWRLMPHMINLQALEIDCTYWRSSGEEKFMVDIADPPIPCLRYAKLFGYIPRSVAKWVIVKCGKTLERLELGMLDRPVSPMYFPILPHHDGILAAPEDDEKERPRTDPDSDRGDWHIPRPLRGFLSPETDADETLLLPRLKHVYLCRPSIRFGRYLEYSWSSKVEQASLADWRKILLSSSKTLETLVIEDRPGATIAEKDTWDSPGFMQGDKEGVGAKLLVEMLEGLLFEQGAFPKLRQVYMYGIPICRSLQHPTELVPGGRLMQRLKDRDVKCEARLGSWCYFHWETGLTDWERSVPDEEYWHSDEDDEDEEEEKDEIAWDTVLESV